MNKEDEPVKQDIPPLDETRSPKPDTFGLKSLRALRRLSDKILKEKTISSPDQQDSLSAEESQRVIYELQAHQVELEAQNEELRQTQENLELLRARYFDLYDLAPVGYCTIDEKGLIIEANLTAANLLGVARGSLVGQPVTRFINNEDRDDYYQYRKQLFDNNTAPQNDLVHKTSGQTTGPSACELRMLKKDGTVFWINLREIVAKGTDSTPVYWFVLTDITERKQSEEQRVKSEAKKRHMQKVQSLELMAGSISHHFNNHLQIVMGNLEMALDSLPGNGAGRENLLNAIRATHRSSEVSGLLLRYLGQNNAKLERLNLSEIFQQNLPGIEAAMPNGISLKTELKSPGPVVNGNARQLQKILTCLITNAWESIGDRAGIIKVVIKTVQAPDISTSYISYNDWSPSGENFACLEVTDTGRGMSEEEMGKIFDPFFTTKTIGRGLGLAVSMGIVRSWDGMIFVKSALREGSCFSVLLPLVEGVVPDQSEILTEHGNIKTAGTVLLVDDDAILLEIMEHVLQNLGFKVFVADSGKEAVVLLQKHQDIIDYLITDLSMPDMDGWETLAALRKIRPDLPAVLSSGYDETQAMSGDHDESFQGFLHKPYTKADLNNVLGRILGKLSKNA